MSENGEHPRGSPCTMAAMLPGHAENYEALKARDARFDGMFFVGVSTTGIYCRPICPARTPRRENCAFFATAARAEDAGYRPCLRCRPELAPGNASTEAVPRLARRVLERIEEGGVDERGLDALASELGASPRHMRRVVRQAYGVTPVALLQTHRLLLAKRLLTETRLAVIEVAHASGFESLRRFNHLVRTRYRMTPTQIRRSARAAPEDTVVASLCYRPPLDWRALGDFLGGRAIPGVEEFTMDGALRRTIAVGGRAGWIELRDNAALSRVEIRMSAGLAPVLPAVLARAKRLCDLGANPTAVGSALGTLARARPGLRIPGATDPFELSVRAILGQQVSVRAASTLAARVAARFGDHIETPHPALSIVFPAPQRIADATESDLVALGIVRARSRAIIGLARAIASGALALESCTDPEEAVQSLCGLPGIGPWTAHYIAMRGLGWPDAFPAGDLVLRRALGGVSARRAAEISEQWRPWRSYAVIHLWKSQEPSP